MSVKTPRPARPPLVVFDPFARPKDAPLESAPHAWWAECKLRTTLSEPRVHEVALPDEGKSKGKKIVLTLEEMHSPHKLRLAFLDQLGFPPPLEPDKKKVGDFLRGAIELLFEKRDVISVVREASERGTLEGDIEWLIRRLPAGEDANDFETGALVSVDRGRFFSSRALLERVRRFCPVKFKMGEYYEALKAVGCVHHDQVRLGPKKVHAWQAPASLFTEATAEPAEASTGIREAVPQPSQTAPSGPLASGTFASAPANTAFPFVDADEHDAFEPPEDDA